MSSERPEEGRAEIIRRIRELEHRAAELRLRLWGCRGGSPEDVEKLMERFGECAKGVIELLALLTDTGRPKIQMPRWWELYIWWALYYEVYRSMLTTRRQGHGICWPENWRQDLRAWAELWKPSKSLQRRKKMEHELVEALENLSATAEQMILTLLKCETEDVASLEQELRALEAMLAELRKQLE